MDEQTQTQQPQGQKKSNGRAGFITLIAIIILVAGGAFAYTQNKKSTTKTATDNQSQNEQQMSGDDSSMAPVATTPGQTQGAATGTSDSIQGSDQNGEKTFTITGQNFSFTPNTITVNKGDKVKIIFQNSGGFHDFVLPDFNVGTATIGNGESATVEFTADKTGTFVYFCSVGNHRQMGMQGSLVVQ